MAYIYPTFLRWENHIAYYKAKLRNITIGDYYCNCIYYNGNCKNSCGCRPTEDPYWQMTCYVNGSRIDNGGKMYKVKLYTPNCGDDELDWSYMQIPLDPDVDPCEFACQDTCELSCQAACQTSCQTHCQSVCQSCCETSDQTIIDPCVCPNTTTFWLYEGDSKTRCEIAITLVAHSGGSVNVDITNPCGIVYTNRLMVENTILHFHDCPAYGITSVKCTMLTESKAYFDVCYELSQDPCQVACQTTCQLTAQFCGRECDRELDR